MPFVFTSWRIGAWDTGGSQLISEVGAGIEQLDSDKAVALLELLVQEYGR